MADIAEIGIGVDTSEFVLAKTGMTELDKKFATTVNSLISSSKRWEKAIMAPAAVQQQANEIMFGAAQKSKLDSNMNSIRQRIQMMEKSSAMEQRAATESLKAQAAIDRETAAIQKQAAASAQLVATKANDSRAREIAEYEMLAGKYNQVYASSRLYESSLNELNRAHQLGVISAKQQESAVEALNLEYQAFQAGAVVGMNRFANAAQQTAGRTNQLGVVVQQTGYQVGDFLVQVQSGQNWMVAFGQQATQLVGTLPLLAGTLGMSATKLIAISTGLGIAIPLMTALGAYFMRSGESADKASKDIGTYAEAIKAANEEVKNLNADLLEMRFPNLTDAQGLLKLQLDEATLKAEDLRAKLQEVAEGPNFAKKGQVLENISLDLENAVYKANELEKSYKNISDRQKELAGGAAEAARFEEKRRQIAESILAPLRAEKAERERMLGVTTQANVLYGKSRIEGQALAEAAKYTGIEMARAASIKFGNLAEALAYLNSMASAAASTANYLAAIGKTSSGSGPDAARSGAVYLGGDQLLSQPTGAGMADPKIPKGGGGGGGGGSGVEDQLQKELDQIRESFATKAELEIEEYTKQQETLKSALDSKLLTLGEYNNLELQMSKDHASKLNEIDAIARAAKLNDTANLFGALATIAQVGGKKAAKAAAVLAAIQTTVSGYATAMSAAAQTPSLFGKIAVYAGWIATTVKAVSAINQAGGTGGGTGGMSSGGAGGRGSADVAPNAAPQAPQRVLVQGINPDDIFTGQWLSNFFDSFYKENNDRGAVFMVNK